MRHQAQGLRTLAGSDGKLKVCHHYLAEGGQYGHALSPSAQPMYYRMVISIDHPISEGDSENFLIG